MIIVAALMGILTVLVVEVFRSIKNRNKDPELEYFKNKTTDITNEEEVLRLIDHLIKIKDKEGTEEWIDLYIEYNQEDNKIMKRMKLLKQL